MVVFALSDIKLLVLDFRFYYYTAVGMQVFPDHVQPATNDEHAPLLIPKVLHESIGKSASFLD